jgi:hypothetical protein
MSVETFAISPDVNAPDIGGADLVFELIKQLC